PINFFWLIVAIVLPLCASPFVNFLYETNQKLDFPGNLMEMIRNTEKQAEAVTKMFLKMPTVNDLLFNLFLIAVLPAIAEEFFFRGVVQKVFYESFRNVHAVVWITAALFSFIHFQFMGFLPRMFLGVLLGYLFAYSGSIWVPVIAHVFNNGAQVVAAYLFQRGIIDYNIEDNTPAPYYAVVASALVTLALIYIMQKRRYVQPQIVVNETNHQPDRDDLPFV
ncbi:MAG TPA: CPBP family intramembrane glutamic endopeptidase, partial [Flavobacteriales bacterium]|nr:CPBP family intramembrane glutamic endopeptidase [Flavobacteriales bacterium]